MTSRERAKSAGRRLAIIRHAKEVSGNVSQTRRDVAPHACLKARSTRVTGVVRGACTHASAIRRATMAETGYQYGTNLRDGNDDRAIGVALQTFDGRLM